MKIIYLGTAASEAIPALFCQCPVCEDARHNLGREYRARSGAAIGESMLIDFPPDIYSSSIRAGYYLPGVKDIFITHSHFDHCDENELSTRVTPVTCKRKPGEDYTTNVYGNNTVLKKLDSLSNSDGLSLNYIVPYKPVKTGNITVTALPAEHTKVEKCYIYLIEEQGKRFLYGNDTGYFLDETIDYLKGIHLDAVSLDCTYAMMECGRGWGHMGLALNIELKKQLIAQETADDKTIFIAHHFSHNGFYPDGRQYTLEEFENIAAEDGFIVSYDGMRLEL